MNNEDSLKSKTENTEKKLADFDRLDDLEALSEDSGNIKKIMSHLEKRILKVERLLAEQLGKSGKLTELATHLLDRLDRNWQANQETLAKFQELQPGKFEELTHKCEGLSNSYNNIINLSDLLKKRDNELAKWLHNLSKDHRNHIHGHAEIEAWLKSLESWLRKLEKQQEFYQMSIREEHKLLQQSHELLSLNVQEILSASLPSKQLTLKEKEKIPTEKTTQIKDQLQDYEYFIFEERYRGKSEAIKEMQSHYTKYFKGYKKVLDLGCGRGEFLELLTEAGIDCYGVDINENMVWHSQQKGLKVIKSEVIKHLETLEDNSLDGIFAAQLIEHLHVSELVALARLCFLKLRPNGCLILETINPCCVFGLVNFFYTDLSHLKPIHPEAVRFLLQMRGFFRAETIFLNPVLEHERLKSLKEEKIHSDKSNNLKILQENLGKLNNLLFGYQDYAVIAYKSAKNTT